MSTKWTEGGAVLRAGACRWGSLGFWEFEGKDPPSATAVGGPRPVLTGSERESGAGLGRQPPPLRPQRTARPVPRPQNAAQASHILQVPPQSPEAPPETPGQGLPPQLPGQGAQLKVTPHRARSSPARARLLSPGSGRRCRHPAPADPPPSLCPRRPTARPAPPSPGSLRAAPWGGHSRRWAGRRRPGCSLRSTWLRAGQRSLEETRRASRT